MNEIIPTLHGDNLQRSTGWQSAMKDWMTNNKSQLNEDKTDMILTSPRKVLNNVPIPSELCLNGTNIKLSQIVRKLGVTLCQTLSFQQHISNVCCTCCLELRRISTIRRYLPEDATKKSARSYCLG